ncbi:RNA-directed DNA polymerase from mobile element jockey [Trichonephila clavipes]|nr:RNA-directed DNA polymerase from mobile element jockey [Trichonephila clavipes]
MLTLRYFPKSWKTAVVVPILKPGKNSALAESYRPISLLPVLSKLAEKNYSSQTQRLPRKRKKILIPEQHGFRPRLSTSHQLLRVVEFIKEGNNNDECTAAVFLDIQKAFDRGPTGLGAPNKSVNDHHQNTTFAMPPSKTCPDMGLRTASQSRCPKKQRLCNVL